MIYLAFDTVEEIKVAALVNVGEGGYDIDLGKGNYLFIFPMQIKFLSQIEKDWEMNEFGVCFVLQDRGVFIATQNEPDLNVLSNTLRTVVSTNREIIFIGTRSISVKDQSFEWMGDDHVEFSMAKDDEIFSLEIGNITGGEKDANLLINSRGQEICDICRLIRRAEEALAEFRSLG